MNDKNNACSTFQQYVAAVFVPPWQIFYT